MVSVASLLASVDILLERAKRTGRVGLRYDGIQSDIRVLGPA